MDKAAMYRAADNARWALMQLEGDLQTLVETIEVMREEEVPSFSQELPRVANHIEGFSALVARMLEGTAALRREVEESGDLDFVWNHEEERN